MTDAITTTVSWTDLELAYDDELEGLRDGYDELVEHAESEYGDDWQTTPTGDDTLHRIRQEAARYNEAAKSIQKRQHLLGQLKDEYGDGGFELKMLSGEETMQVETELRMLAHQDDVSVDVIQVRRNALTVDAATVDAPSGVPRDDDGSPVPSECPNALTLALWEQVESLNNAGETGFQAGGFGDTTALLRGATSGTPTGSPGSSTRSAPTEDT